MQFSEQWLRKMEKYECTLDGFVRKANALVENEEGQIVMLYDKRYDMYSLPGGKIDKGEDWQQALVREVKEETDLDIVSVDTSFCRGVKQLWRGGREYNPMYRVEAEGVAKACESFMDLHLLHVVPDDSRLGFAFDVGDKVYRDLELLYSFYDVTAWFVGEQLGDGDWPWDEQCLCQSFDDDVLYVEYLDCNDGCCRLCVADRFNWSDKSLVAHSALYGHELEQHNRVCYVM